MAQERKTMANARLLAAELRDCVGPAVDQRPSCAPSGSGCEPGSVCISGTCTFCKEAACGTACTSLRGHGGNDCARAVIQATAAASDRQLQAREQDRKAAAQWKGVPDQVLAWADARSVALDKEDACRASSQCVKDRAIAAAERQKREAVERAEANLKKIVDGLCQDLSVRRAAYATIARENSNPAGVRDLAALHEAGSDIQDMDKEIQRLKGLYVAQVAQPGMSRKPFAESMCK